MEAIGDFSVDHLVEQMRRFSEQKTFGWRALDEREIGVAAGDFTVIAGRTGHGKSCTLFNLLAHWLVDYPEEHFAFYSYEIPQESVMLRLISILTRRGGAEGWTYNDIYHYLRQGAQQAPDGLDIDALELAIRTLKEFEPRMTVVYRPDWTVDQLAQHARELSSKVDHLGGILVDYLQLVGPPEGSHESREIEVALIARKLKRLAVNLDCATVAAAQIRSESLKNAEPVPHGKLEDQKVMDAIARRRPQLHHLGDRTGEQEADLVLGILNFQADFLAAAKDAGLEDVLRIETGSAGPFEVAVIKNRNGRIGAAPLVLEAMTGFVRDPGVFGR